MRKRFLDPQNLFVPYFGLLAQCICAGFQNEKTDEGAAEKDTKDEYGGSMG